MSQTTINTTDSPETGRVAINANFTDLYATKQDVVSGVSNTEIGYLDGVTSAIQTQINNTIKGILVFGGGVAPSVTRFAVHGTGDATVRTNEYEAQIPVGEGVVKNLRVWICANAGITSYVVTVRKNGVDTSLTTSCTVNATTGTLYSDTTNSFTTVSGDLISVKIVTGTNGGFTSAFAYYTVEMSQA